MVEKSPPCLPRVAQSTCQAEAQERTTRTPARPAPAPAPPHSGRDPTATAAPAAPPRAGPSRTARRTRRPSVVVPQSAACRRPPAAQASSGSSIRSRLLDATLNPYPGTGCKLGAMWAPSQTRWPRSMRTPSRTRTGCSRTIKYPSGARPPDAQISGPDIKGAVVRGDAHAGRVGPGDRQVVPGSASVSVGSSSSACSRPCGSAGPGEALHHLRQLVPAPPRPRPCLVPGQRGRVGVPADLRVVVELDRGRVRRAALLRAQRDRSPQPRRANARIAAYVRWRNARARPKVGFAVGSSIRTWTSYPVKAA
jgi:hypothetical protein